jgi:alkylated DNA repair dioxygenase AlkB
MNLYEDGNHYIAPHSDDEPLWGDNPIIASLSFGETRKFILEEKFDKNSNSSSKQKKSYSFYLSNGSLLVMKGETQKYWKHSISKDKNITKPRINLTFRKMI